MTEGPPAGAPASGGYALLDSGGGRKLERVGGFVLDRQAAQAFWAPRLPESSWKAADAIHHRGEHGGGRWEFRRKLPEEWSVSVGGLELAVRPTAFGHLGLFVEHAMHWAWMAESIGHWSRQAEPPSVLNLFAYTGGATLACARAGATLCHVDAARGIVDWARENARRNRLQDHPIRWIVEDCTAFLEREVRRGRRYQALILDPPSFGRGARKELWKIEDHLPSLLDLCGRVLVERPHFVLLSAHSPGFTPVVLGNLLAAEWPDRGPVESGEMVIAGEDGRPLPSGAFARFRVDGGPGRAAGLPPEPE